MKSLFLLIFIFGLNFAAKEQEDFQFDSNDNIKYAVINDIDGFTNVRKLPGNSSQIVGKINKYKIFSCQPNKTN